MVDLNDPVLRVFFEEGAEQIESLNGLLLRLESDPRDLDILSQIMRVAHNLKGASGTAGLQSISDVAHRVEDVIQRLRAGTMEPEPPVFDLLFRTMDALQASLDEISQGKSEGDVLHAAVDDLDQILKEKDRRRSTSAGANAMLGFAIGEYDHIRIKVLRQKGKRLLRLDLEAAKEESEPLEWAKRVLRALRRSSEIVSTLPPEIDLKVVEQSRRLSVLCGTLLTHEEVAALLAQEKLASCDIKEAETPASDPTVKAEVGSAKQRGSMKVDLARVDGLVDMIGELVIVQSMVTNAPEVLALKSRSVRNHLSQLTRITRELQDSGLRLRMVPLRSVFQTMARTVRDLAGKQQKDIMFSASGEDVEMDRSVVERITDPLVHLVRNAVDHGVESGRDREQLGKPKTASISLSAYHQGGSIVVEVTDDGRGLNRDAILDRALALGLVREGAAPTDSDIFNLIFESGFSTAKTVTDTSGRGVGLDIVRRNVEAMRGRVTVSSEPNRGTTIRMILPLTLAIIDGMLIQCGPERYIIPTIAIIESIRPKPSAVLPVSGRFEMLNVRGAMLPLVPLGALFGVEAACKDASSGLVVVVEGIGRKVGLVVDDVISQQQVVIKSIGSGLGTARYLSGAAILSDGSVGLIVNVDEIAAAGCVDTGRKDAPSEGGSLATAALGSADRATEAHSRQ